MTTKKLLSLPMIMLMGLLALSTVSCESDEPTLPQDQIEKAQDILKGTIVLNSRGISGGVDRTLLKTGMPLKYTFTQKGEDTFNMVLEGFNVGSMPMSINFTIDAKYLAQNSWEDAEHKGGNWVKFTGEQGKTSFLPLNPGMPVSFGDGDGGKLTGFLNLDTKEVEFTVDFNVAGYTAETFLQKVDYSRLEKFDELRKQFEEDFAKAKEEGGQTPKTEGDK